MIMHIKVLYISDYVIYVMGYHDNAYQSVVHIRLCHGDTMIMHIKVLYIPDYVMGYHDNAYQSVVHIRFM